MLSIIGRSFLLFIFSLLPKFGFIDVLSGGMGEGRGGKKKKEKFHFLEIWEKLYVYQSKTKAP